LGSDPEFSGREVVAVVMLEPLDLRDDGAPARSEPGRADQEGAHDEDGDAEDEEQGVRHFDLPFAGGGQTPAP